MMPVYEDWASAAEVCRRIDASIGDLWAYAHIVLINDGSRTDYWDAIHGLQPQRVRQISVLDLHRNLGHQRAIAVAMAYAAANLSAQAVVVMDADGEDPPEQIPTLIAEAGKNNFSAVVFAERGRRVEGLMFRAFYLLYRTLHYALTGRKIRVGNFSVLPWDLMRSLVTYPELWNHYAAAVLQSRLPTAMTRLDRGKRIQGKSKMRFVDLVMHGLSALFAYHDLVGTRLLIANFLLMILAAAAIVGLFLTHGDLKIPLAIVIAILAGQFSTISLLAIFLVVMNRSSYQFLPARDYIHFVRGLVSVVRLYDDTPSR